MFFYFYVQTSILRHPVATVNSTMQPIVTAQKQSPLIISSGQVSSAATQVSEALVRYR